MIYKLGSLFDGSGGFPLAGALCGIEPTWAAEVEPYPIAVTRSRFDGDADTPLLKLARKHHPELKLISVHLGNVCEINGAEIEPVDIITFGSPCQDLSVAGKRAGLKHEANGDEETTRSGLFMEAVRIIKEMREATNGRYPTFALWENVPGAFSSNKGEDFRTVLEELIRVVEPHAAMPAVPRAGWNYADSFSGSGWSLAYRVFDAQYWGVPQRRRRIHLVVDFRGERAREILFEREGVRGYFAQGRTPWQTAAGDAQDCAGADDRVGESGGGDSHGTPHAVAYRTYDVTEEQQPTLTAKGPGAVAYWDGSQVCGTLTANNAGGNQRMPDKENFNCVIACNGNSRVRYIVRRLTPTECARLQGFDDRWGDINHKDSFTDEEYAFWAEVRVTHAVINGKEPKTYSREQMLTWYNNLHTDSAEYKMWGNGIALPPALYCMQGIADALKSEDKEGRGDGKV